MKVTFIGGGSLRLLPILRGMAQVCPQVFEDSELRFFDLAKERAEANIVLLKHCPEFKFVKNCRLVCPETLDDALKNIDICYITMGIRTQPQSILAGYASLDSGINSSDQLSITGAFYALKLGRIVYGIAEKLKKYSPHALMLIFANPVAIYSSMIERFLGIRALGICGGFANHRYDLTRLLGRDEYDDNYDIVAAGINHLSFILRGTYKNEDIYQTLAPAKLDKNWQNIFAPDTLLHEVMDLMYDTYQKSKYLVFSSEIDGLFHLAPERILPLLKKLYPDRKTFNPAESGRISKEKMENSFKFLLESAKNAENIDWNNDDEQLFKVDTRDISIPIFKAFAGIEKMRIVASKVNAGVLPNMPYNAAVEYTMDIEGNKITPVENQFVPEPFLNIISPLSEFQTLVGEAVAKRDCKIFAQALETYPLFRKDVVIKHFEIFKDIIDNDMQETLTFFQQKG